MQYDPVKRRLGVVFNSTPLLRKLFYHLLDLLLLRWLECPDVLLAIDDEDIFLLVCLSID